MLERAESPCAGCSDSVSIDVACPGIGASRGGHEILLGLQHLVSRVDRQSVGAFLRKTPGVLVRSYKVLAVVTLNAILLAALVNIVADLGLSVQDALRKKSSDGPGASAFRRYHPSLAAVYPGMDQTEIEQLVKESRAQELMYEPYCQFREKPYRGTYYHIEPAGFRRVRLQAPWPPREDRLNVFLFGGSTTFGTRVSDSETIASHLQDFVAVENGLPVAVYNFGRSGYLSVQERILFEQLLASGFRPHVAIFIDGLNDLVFARGEPMLTPQIQKAIVDGQTSLGHKVCNELPLGKAVCSIVGRTGPPPVNVVAGLSEDHVVEGVLARYLANKGMIEGIAKAFDVIPLFVWQPIPVWEYDIRCHIFKGYDFAAWSALKPGYHRMAQLHGAGALGDDFLWMADIQKDSKKPLYVDAVHYSGEMCGMIARHIGKALLDRELMPAHGLAARRAPLRLSNVER